MNFKPILLLSTMVTCLYCHFALYASQNSQLFPSMEADAGAYIANYVNAEDQELSSVSVSQSNIAPLGMAYGWSKMTSSTANTGKVSEPGLNDNNLTANIDLQPNGDKVGAWEAAGIIWQSPATITVVDFINGNVTRDGDGFLTAHCMLQFSTDGVTWTNSGWTISPSYPNSASASGKTYTFSGPAASGILGVRVVGQVRTTDTSYHWIVKEVQVTGNIGPVSAFTIAASAGAGGSIAPSGSVSVIQGSSQTFNITPATGYTIASVTVDGLNQGSIGSYTFSNVQANHSISATFSSGSFTPQQIITAVQSHMTPSVQVNTLPHTNTMTGEMNVNVYQVAPGVFAYTSSMAIDDDGRDPDPDPDHQNQTNCQDSSGAQLGAHHVAYYVLGDNCYSNTSPCPYFYYPEHNITCLQFALIFYNGKVIGAVFGDTQGWVGQTNYSRQLGEASTEAAVLLGIPSSGTTGGVDNGVTVVIFSGPQWVLQGTNQGTGPTGSATGSLNGNAQALVQNALNTLGAAFGL